VPDDQHPKVFLISPIGEAETETRKKADKTLKHLVRKALEPEPLNCEVERADEDPDPGSITPRMLNSIMTADLVVIDLTDQNANVFYEMAIAHGYRRPCVHIITEGQKVPFDVKDMNTVPYTLTDPDKLEAAVTKLSSYATTALQSGTTNTPLSAAERFNVVQSSTDTTVEALAEMTSRLDDLRAEVWDGFQLAAKLGRQPKSVVGNQTVVLTRDWVEHKLNSDTTYPEGTKGYVAWIYQGVSGTHLDVLLPGGELLSLVPIDYLKLG
jgi:hypothetical protein